MTISTKANPSVNIRTAAILRDAISGSGKHAHARAWFVPGVTGILLGSLAFAQQASAVQNVLFVGNSFTHGNYQPVLSYNNTAITDANGTGYGGIPGIFEQMAGANYNVTIEAVSSQTLIGHYQTESAIIGNPKWNTVILQEQSTTPLPASHGGTPSDFSTGASELKNLVLSNNAAAKMLLYETWASPTTVSTNGYTSSGATPTAQLQAMQTDLQNAYFNVKYNQSFNAVARVGDAFLQAINDGYADPTGVAASGTGFSLWGPDNRHPSIYGAYLSAAVFYAKITQQDPRNLPTGTGGAAAGLGISATDAAHLDTVAYEINSLTDPAAPPPPPPSQILSLTHATFTGSVTAGTPPNITGNAILSGITLSDSTTYTNVKGATANNVVTSQVNSSVGTAPASSAAAASGLTANDGVNNLTSGNFQFAGSTFDAQTRFFIMESAPTSGSPGDPTTVTLLDSNNAQVGTYSLDLTAGEFTNTVANNSSNALATLNYDSGVSSLTGGIQSKLSGVSFSLSDLGVTDFSSIGNVTGIRLSSGTLDPNVVGTYETAVPEPSSLALLTCSAMTLLTRGRRRRESNS